MMKVKIFGMMAVVFFLLVACDSFSTEPGSFVVLFQWETGHEPDTAAKEYYIWAYYQEWKGGEGKTFPADIESNAKSLDETGPVKLGSGDNLNFTKLTYGDNRFVRAAIWDNEERTGDPLYVGVSELFNFSASDRNKTVAVNMKLQANAGVDETGGSGSFAIEVRHNGTMAERVAQPTVTLRFTVKNADTIIIANDLNFEKGVTEKKLTELTKIDDTTYELAAWDITEGWVDLGDALYSVLGKSRNTLGYESVPKRAEVYLDTTAPFLTVKTDALAYNASGIVTITVSSNETLRESPVIGIYDADEALVKDISADAEELQAGTSYRYQIPVIGTLDDGNYHIVTSAADLIDNTTADIVSDPFAVDSLAPELDGDPVITPDRIAAEQSYTVTFTTKEDMSGGLVTVQRKEETLTCTNTGLDYTCTGTSTAGEGDAIDPVTISLTDAAGNIGSFNAGTLYIDRTEPTLAIDLNKNAFNAADTIRITVTASEELDGEPVVTIPGASMTLSSPTQISGFSWLYTVDPTLFDDGNYTVNGSGDDLVALNGADSADFSVDSSVPDLVTGTVDRVKAGIGITYTVDFEISEPVIGTGGVPVVKANSITLTNCAKNGADKVFRCTRTIGAEETDATVYTITAALADAAGNSRTVTIGSVMADKILPDIALGTTVLSIDAGADCALSQEQVTTLADGSTAYLSLQVSEKLESGYAPVLVASKTGAPALVFALDAQSGLTYYFSLPYNEPTPTEDIVGTYSLSMTLKDEAGNETTANVSPDKPFKIGWNDPVLVVDQNAVSYTRSPWGRVAETELKDGAGAVQYIIPANEYYEIGPNDVYEATDRFPSGTVTINYGSGTGMPVTLKAWDTTGTELRLEHSTQNTDGSWPRSRIWSYNAAEIYVSAIDSSCHETAQVKIQNVNWITTMNKKMPGDYYTNPNNFYTNGVMGLTLEQNPATLLEPLNGGVSLNIQTGEPQWDQWTEKEDTPSARYRHAMAYDSIRGKILMFGGYDNSSTDDETWEWDGANWTKLNPAAKPSARDSHAMAYDSARGKIVLFGGASVSSNDETWEWNGTNWIQQNPASKPSARYKHAMAYDSVRGKILLFGGITTSGHSNETWEWDGVNWTQLNPVTAPSAREGHAMVYDSARGKVLLFGGYSYSGENVYFDDTWEWDGANWTQLNPATIPSARTGHAMAYDTASGKALLFGGYNGTAYNNEMWEWNGANWNQVNPTAKPSARYLHAMVYDRAKGEVVLFAGALGGNEMWKWDGANWTHINPATTPSAGKLAAMAYDSTRGKALLFGGSAESGSSGNETWEWGGAKWTKLDPATKPTARTGHAMAFDSVRGKVVMFGGGDNQTWEWDGTNWTRLSPLDSPSSRKYHAMAFDPMRGKVVLFGGYFYQYSCSSETWEWDGTNWTLRTPINSPTPRFNHAMAFDGMTGRMLLFGGYDDSNRNNETWAWDGNNWTQLSPSTSPSARSGHSMAYDSYQLKVLLFGGVPYNNETWIWDGSNWNLYNPTSKPSTRYLHAMAYDSTRKEALLYGGVTETSTPITTETWKWSGGNWTQVNIDTSPTARYGHAMAYDNIGKQVIMFGGSTTSTTDETWGWSAFRWTQMNSIAKPSARDFHAMAYDSAREKMVLFGGMLNNETWEWDGAGWIRKYPVNKPSARWYSSMAYDAVTGKAILFGGYYYNGSTTYFYDETWEWDGTNWSLATPANKPSARSSHAMAYDSLREKIVLFGGGSSGDETWEWDGTNWEQMNPATKPSARQKHAMTYDLARGKALLFGGSIQGGSSNETWEWNGINWTRLTPTTKPSARYAHTITYDNARDKTVLFGGISSSEKDVTWLLNAGGNERPGQIMNISVEGSGIIDDSNILALSVFFNAGGLGDITGTPTNGVDLLAWKHDRWETVASNEADPDNLAPVTWETTDPVEIQTLLNSGLRKFNFAVVPTAPNGFLTDMGSIATDYAEVIVRYTAQ